MFANVYQILNTTAVNNIVNGRIYGFGSAPQNINKPYITWFVVATDPHNQLSGAPCGDTDTVQIDCFIGPNDTDESTCVALATAVRNALDAAGQANRVIINSREVETKLFRISIQAEFIHNR